MAEIIPIRNKNPIIRSIADKPGSNVTDLVRRRALNSIASYHSRDPEVVNGRNDIDLDLSMQIRDEVAKLPDGDPSKEVLDFIEHLDIKHGRPAHLVRFLRDHERNKNKDD